MNKMMKSILGVVSIGILAFACTSVPVSKEPKLSEVALSKELQEKYQIADYVAPTPTPSPTASPEPESSGKKKPKGSEPKKKIKAASAVVPLVYPDRARKPSPIWIGESETFEVTYLGLPAGNFTTEVLPFKNVAGRPVYHLKGNVKSSSAMNLFYRFDDTIESFWDVTGIFSHRFHMVQDESKQYRDVLEIYDNEKKKVLFWNRRQMRTQPQPQAPTETHESFDLAPFAQDSFTAIFYARSLPLVDGEVYSFPVVSEGKPWDCVITVVGREMMDTPMGRIRTILLQPQTRYNGLMQQTKGKNFIWVTDDDRRLVVRLEAQVKIGTVTARLKKVELGQKP